MLHVRAFSLAFTILDCAIVFAHFAPTPSLELDFLLFQNTLATYRIPFLVLGTDFSLILHLIGITPEASVLLTNETVFLPWVFAKSHAPFLGFVPGSIGDGTFFFVELLALEAFRVLGKL